MLPVCNKEIVLIVAEFSPDWKETDENIYFLLHLHDLLLSLACWIYWTFHSLKRDVALGRLKNGILRFLPEGKCVWFQLITLVFSREESRRNSGLRGSWGNIKEHLVEVSLAAQVTTQMLNVFSLYSAQLCSWCLYVPSPPVCGLQIREIIWISENLPVKLKRTIRRIWKCFT